MKKFSLTKKGVYAFAYICAFVFVQMLFSCGNTDDLLQQVDLSSTDYRVSPKEAGDMALSIATEIRNNETRGGDASKSLSVKDVTPLGTHDMTATRSEDTDATVTDTLIYIVNFSDSCGFAIVSADKRTEPVYAVIDKGNASVPLAQTDTLIGEIITTLVTPNTYPIYEEGIYWNSNGWSISEIVHPVLKTKWGQDNPYNKYCPIVNSSKSPTGCVQTAISQIISFFKTPSESLWKNNKNEYYTTLHWEQIIKDCKDNKGILNETNYPQSSNEVALLMRYLGERFGASYDKYATSTISRLAINWMKQVEGLSVSSLQEYNETTIRTCLKNKGIVFARGNAKNGHAWVYDGYCKASKDGTKHTFIHCNWGWDGDSDGYYISKLFDTGSGPIFYDNIDNGNNVDVGNYQNNLEIATFYTDK